MLLMYSQSNDGFMEKLKTLLGKVPNLNRIECYSSLGTLIKRLRHSRMDLDIGIFLINSEDELDNLISIRELVIDLRIVFILVASGKEIISKAHSFGPRFVAHWEDDLDKITAVLSKMIDRKLKMAS